MYSSMTRFKLTRRILSLGLSLDIDTLTDEEIKIFMNHRTWGTISKAVNLSPEFIVKYADKLSWEKLVRCQYLRHEIVEKYKHRMPRNAKVAYKYQ